MSNLVKYLFETNAFRVCEKNKPFWYTSGKIGPYFINTHFLYGSEKEAVELLDFIDIEKETKLDLPKKVFEKTFEQYKNNKIYKDTIDSLIEIIKSNINLQDIDYISGGERRDWFFSNIVAYLLEKPHITIFKDLSSVESSSDFSKTTNTETLKDKKVLHIADLITIASSYFKLWIPTIENLGGKICWSAVVVDRLQGGSEKLSNSGISSYSLIQISPEMFSTALDLGIINNEQKDILVHFYKDPDNSMREFLLSHPDFLENALNSDEKTAKRAKSCVENDLYNLK